MGAKVRRLVGLVLLPLTVAQGGVGTSTVFSIRFEISADPNAATPQEYFNAMQEAFADAAANGETGGGTGGGTGGLLTGGVSQVGQQLIMSHFDQGTLLSQVALTEAVESQTMKVCDMEPFWEKGQTVFDLRLCRLSPVKLIIWALVPALTLSCGLLGLWSRQRNVRGHGKETKISNLVGCGVSFLSVGYDWFFSWTLYRNPVGDFQQRVYEVGLVCLAVGIVINFLSVHFWFRRKFLVSMPWYEYHKHGLGLHFVFLLMYVNPQACCFFTSRLFDIDLFNIHFGTPSKMNEVLSNVGCLSLLIDVPLMVLKSAVFFLDTNGLQAPKVTRVSMGVTAIHLTLVVKRQYVASVERSWYQEIVRMAGVRRLTTYGGASRWLKFQKRPSAAAELQGAASSQQQLFLAWMQSMGRRQDSIFQDAASKPLATEDSDEEDDDDELSDDSEDELDSLSPSDNEAKAEDQGAARSSRRANSQAGLGEEGSGSESSGKLELQAHRGGTRPAREERPLQSRGLEGSEHGLLGFARQVADEVGPSDEVSASDIMMFAKKVAQANHSESGVITESSGVGFDFRAGARHRAQEGSVAESDVLAFARQVAQGAGSTAGTDVPSDIFAFARKAAQDVSAVGTDMSVLAFAQAAARNRQGGPASSASSLAEESDVLAFARKAARQLPSRSGITSDWSAASAAASGNDSNVLSFARKVAKDFGEAESSAAATESDIFAFARDAAQNVSQSGAASTGEVGAAKSTASSLGTFDMVEFAHNVAQDVSQGGFSQPSEASHLATSQATSTSDVLDFARRAAATVASSAVPSSDLFVKARPGGSLSVPAKADQESSVLSEDLFTMAKKTADQVSQVNSSVAGSSLRGGFNELLGHAESNSGVSQLDIFAEAQRAAAQVSRSGIQSAMSMGLSEGGIRDLLAPVKAPPSEPSEVDLMAVAQGAAQQASRSGAGSSISESPAKITELFAANKAGDESETSDLFAIANKAAEETSQVSSVSAASAGPKGLSGLFTSRPRAIVAPPQPEEASEASEDLWAFARVTAAEASRSGVSSTSRASNVGNIKELFAPPRRVASAKALSTPEAPPEPEASDAGLSDLFASAYKAAQEASRSGVHSEVPGTMADLFGQKGPKQVAPKPVARSQPAQEPSVISDGSDLLAAARASADQEPSVVSDGSDLLAVAKGAADQVSRSGVQSSVAGTTALKDVFGKASKAQQADDASSLGGSDLMAVAQGAAANASRSGVQSSVAGGNVAELFGARQDFLAAAQSAAEEFSHSGVASDSDILGVARLAARDVSRSGVGNDSDLLGAARRAAAETSEGGTSAATAAVLFAARKGRDFEFVAPRRQMHQDTRHGQPANSDLDAPWALPVPPVLPAVPRRGAADVAPPPDPPPLPERTFWTDTLKGLEEGGLEAPGPTSEAFDATKLVHRALQRSTEHGEAESLEEGEVDHCPSGILPPHERPRPDDSPAAAAARARAAARAVRGLPTPPPRMEGTAQPGSAQATSPSSAGDATSPTSPRSPVGPLSPRARAMERQQMLELRRRTGREDQNYKRKHCRVEASQSPKAGE